MVIADHSQYAPMFGGAEGVGVAHGIRRPVEARPLAVPKAEHAIIFFTAKGIQLLAAPNCRGGQIFIQAGLKVDVMLLEHLIDAAQFPVEAGKGRTAIPRDESRGVETRRFVQSALHEGDAH